MYVATDTDDIIMTSLLQKIEAKILLLKIYVLFSYLGHADMSASKIYECRVIMRYNTKTNRAILPYNT